jgi:hypothetical protein
LSAYVPWSCDRDEFKKETDAVRNTVEACGLLPDDVACTEMDDLDARLACGRMVVVTWRSAVCSVHSLAAGRAKLTASQIYYDLKSHKGRVSATGRMQDMT